MNEAPAVYNYDKNGYFTEETKADACAIEPGVWHHPSQSTLVAPPERKEGTLQRMTETGWILEEVAQEKAAAYVAPEDLHLSEVLVVALQAIEESAKRAREQALGDPTKALEYLAAERDARAFLAGFDTPAPLSVQVWADVRDIDAESAAEEIVSAAEAASKDLSMIRAERLRAREALKAHSAEERATIHSLATLAARLTSEVAFAASPELAAARAESEEVAKTMQAEQDERDAKQKASRERRDQERAKEQE